MVRCKICKEEIPEGAIYCTHCGRYQNIELVRCKICKQEIPLGAQYCTYCNRYQDVRRVFGLSSTVLSLLVALFAVLNNTWPLLVKIVTPSESNVHCSLLEWQSDYVKLVVSNTGISPAVVRGLQLIPGITGASFQLDGTEPILEPGKYQILTFTNRVNHIVSKLPQLDDTLKFHRSLVLMIFPYASEHSDIECANWSVFK
jgi:hypothetical protein